MNRCLGCLKRLIACFMIVATLSFTAAGSYLQVQEFQVYAMAESSIFATLRALVEAVYAYLGISLSSQEDLNTVTYGLYTDMMDNQDFTYGSKDTKPFYVLGQFLQVFVVGQAAHLDDPSFKFLCQYLYGIAQENFAESVTAAAPLPLDVDLGDATFEYVSDFSFLTADTFFQGKPAYYTDSDSTRWNINLDFERYDPTVVIYSLRCTNTEVGNYSLDCSFFPSSYVINSGTVCDYVFIPGTYYYSYGKTYFDVIYSYLSSGSSLYNVTPYTFNFIYYGAKDYWEKVNCEFFFENGSCYIDVTARGCSWGSTAKNNYSVYNRSDIDNISYYVYLRDDVVLWPSQKAYQISKQAAANYAPSAPVYGSKTAASKPLEVDADGNVSVQLKEESITAKVEQAVADAISANQDITQEQINSVVTDIVAVENGVKDAIDDNTGAIEDNTKTLAALLTSVLTAIQGLAVDVSAIKTYTDGSSALVPEKDDIREAFHIVEYVPPDPDDGGDDNDGKVDVWLPPPIISVASFLKPLLEYFGQPLSRITQFQNAILEVLQNLDTWITSIPENLLALFSSYALPLDAIINGINGLPGNLADAIADALHIELPAINFPEIPNYTGLLNHIIELLESFFLINTPAIMSALSGFNDVWEEKLPFWARISGLYNGIDVPDYDPNGRYTYPVISMKTPDILRPFYNVDEIVLVDFADYAEYMIWVRSLIRGILWFSFGLSIFNHLKTNLHIG